MITIQRRQHFREVAGSLIAGATSDIVRSTVSGNMATNGAGIYSYGGTTTIQSSTISGNSAAAIGGGIVNNYSTFSLSHSTVTNNDSASTVGGVYSLGGAGDVYHSIIAKNTATISIPDVAGAFNSLGYNLVGVDDSAPFTATGDKTGTSGSPLDPLLGPLADNGGPTLTHRQLIGSPATDAGDTAIGSPPATDQRGLNRIEKGGAKLATTIDIGAVEVTKLFFDQWSVRGVFNKPFVATFTRSRTTL